MSLAKLRESAELEASGPVRLRGRQTTPRVLILQHGKVRRHLQVEVAVEVLWPHEGQDPRGERLQEGPHGVTVRFRGSASG